MEQYQCLPYMCCYLEKDVRISGTFKHLLMDIYILTMRRTRESVACIGTNGGCCVALDNDSIEMRCVNAVNKRLELITLLILPIQIKNIIYIKRELYEFIAECQSGTFRKSFDVYNRFFNMFLILKSLRF